MPSSTSLIPDRPSKLNSSAQVLRLFVDGVSPLFLNLETGRATFALPTVPDHAPRMIFDPYGTARPSPFTGHVNLSITRANGAAVPLTTFGGDGDLSFKQVVDIETDLYKTKLTPKRPAIPSSFTITEGTIYSAQLTKEEIAFFRNGATGQPPLLKRKITKIIGVEIPVAAGDIVVVTRVGEQNPLHEITVDQSSPEILLGNMCEPRILIAAGHRHDFEFVYAMIDHLGEDDRIIAELPPSTPMPQGRLTLGNIPTGEEGTGPVECWAPMFGITRDLPE
jgi:hypothetical protein